MKRRSLAVLMLCFCVAFGQWSCRSDVKDKNDRQIRTRVNAITAQQDFRAYNIPRPLQIPAAIKFSELKFIEPLLEPHHRDDIYPSNFSRSVNLGMYYVDLSYVTIFNERERGMSYVNPMHRLSQEIGLKAAFGDDAEVRRFERNINNQDSLIQLILDNFDQSHKRLSEIKRIKLAVLMFAGTYIEGLHIMANTTLEIKDHKKRKLFQRLLIEQKYYLDNLLILMEKYCRSIEGTYLISKLKEVERIYKGTEYTFEGEQKTTKSFFSEEELDYVQISKIIKVVGKIRRDLIN